MLVVFLPAQAPEWNPIEFMWNCLTQQLKYFDLSNVAGSDQIVESAATILEPIIYDKIYRFYEKSVVFLCTVISRSQYN